MLDNAGVKKWEVRIPTTLVAIPYRESLLVTADSRLIFSSWALNATEVFQVTAAGEVSASQKLVGQFLIVQSANPTRFALLFGYVEDGSSNLITLDSKLQVVQQVHGALSLHQFAASGGFRMPDRSLLLYGSAVHRFGAIYTTQMVLVDPELRALRRLEFANGSFYDTGQLIAFAPTQQNDEFVVARTLLKHAPGSEGSVGAVIDFVQAK